MLRDSTKLAHLNKEIKLTSWEGVTAFGDVPHPQDDWDDVLRAYMFKSVDVGNQKNEVGFSSCAN